MRDLVYAINENVVVKQYIDKITLVVEEILDLIAWHLTCSQKHQEYLQIKQKILNICTSQKKTDSGSVFRKSVEFVFSEGNIRERCTVFMNLFFKDKQYRLMWSIFELNQQPYHSDIIDEQEANMQKDFYNRVLENGMVMFKISKFKQNDIYGIQNANNEHMNNENSQEEIGSVEKIKDVDDTVLNNRNAFNKHIDDEICNNYCVKIKQWIYINQPIKTKINLRKILCRYKNENIENSRRERYHASRHRYRLKQADPIPQLSHLELELLETEFEGHKELPWETGRCSWVVMCAFSDNARKNNNDVIAGPSGHTSAMLTFMRMFKMFDLKIWTLICIVWLVGADHHSVHEVMLSANEHGLLYSNSEDAIEFAYKILLEVQSNHNLGCNL